MNENLLFAAAMRESDPMYDAAVVSAYGTEVWAYGQSNFLNNSHSVTKFLIAAGVGMLCDRGAVSLADPVISYLDPADLPAGLDPNWRRVTVETALQHKTGIDKIPFGIDDADSRQKIGDDFLRYILSLPVPYEPGTYYRYSDAAYYLLGCVIDRAAGKPAADFIRDNIAGPLHWEQWAAACCPMGRLIGGGGLFIRAADIAKLGFVYANGGVYEGKRLLSESWIRSAMEKDYACTRFRDTDIFVKTGAHGQMVAFSALRRVAAAWHGYSAEDGNNRNDRLLEAFYAHLEAYYPL